MYAMQFLLHHLRCLQTPGCYLAKLSTISSKSSCLFKFLHVHIHYSASPFNLSLVIVDLKSFLINWKVLIDRSHTTLVTGSVAPIWKKNTNKLGNTVLFVTERLYWCLLHWNHLSTSDAKPELPYQRHTLLANHLVFFKYNGDVFAGEGFRSI